MSFSIDFYAAISKHYREIFPLNPMQSSFVKGSFSTHSEKALLDVGCGKGDLVLDLSTSFGLLTGIDLDSFMLEDARVAAPDNTRFMRLDMMNLIKQFEKGAFDGLLCFGNTLVHLPNRLSISEFLQQAGIVLKGKGKLLLQIINYDRILDQDVRSLPTIETENCSFVRNYRYDNKAHLVDFETRLSIKASGESILNKIQLYPLLKTELHSMLLDAGFSSISYFGNFKRDPLEKNSIPMVVEACI